MSNFRIVREYLHRHYAELAQGLLKEQGIESLLQSDDCGGWRPQLSFGSSIKLKVREKDFDQAVDVLKILED
ncbi:MAG: hypothetical protein ACLFPX_01380 [Candidatus Omnitrophota bacterium]